jgi:hypothetical protein
MSEYLCPLNKKDEVELFNDRDLWCNPDFLTEKLIHSLSPHSDFYYSSLCPIFSFEIRNNDSLNLFTSVLLRDGVISLLNFFLKNPTPVGVRTKVLINENLSQIVPKAWFDRVWYYRSHSKVKTNGVKFNYIVNLENYGPMLLESIRNDFKEILSSGYKDINIIPTAVSGFGQGDRSRLPSCIASFSNDISKEFKERDLSFSSIIELDKDELLGSSFKLNKNVFLWTSDSYIAHYLLSNGASDFTQNGHDETSDKSEVELSLYHGMTVFRKQDQASKETLPEFCAFLEEMKIRPLSNDQLGLITDEPKNYIANDIVGISYELVDMIFDKEKNKSIFCD